MPSGIYQHKPLSEETKIKIGEGNKGKKYSKETKEKMRNSHLGKKCPQISKALKGRKLSEETKNKIKKATLKYIHWNWKGGISKNTLCLDCGKKISWGKKRCCKCFHQYYKGKNTLNWKGGITPENVKIRTSIKSIFWRNSIFTRDRYTCQKTGIKGKKLIAHHIQNFAQFPELRFVINNGITLSEEAHKEFHKIYGRYNNTKEQINEFLNQ